ncbi:MAG TPA: hypothetical protein ENG74_03260 [Thermoplasmatales archaeon]|nr:hypothetical protein [Thermoplasmatales archaeon]
MRRETAWRVFAGEYNDSSAIIRGAGERVPSYVVTPLGAKINRLFVVGVLTDVESLMGSNEIVRAHVSDPTGVFTLYSGQFQPEVTATLLSIEVPSFIAFVGKARTFEPEEGVVYVSVRPEVVYEVSSDDRDRWILETCKNTWERIEAISEGLKLSSPNAYDLKKLGYSRDLAEGVIRAIDFYKDIDIEKYKSMVGEALNYLLPEEIEIPEKEMENVVEQKTESGEPDEIENTVLEIVAELEGEEGALWDKIIERCVQSGIDKGTAEEAINSLLDKGLVYEPTLGIIKTT